VNFAYLKIGLGVVCLVALGYWILALNISTIPGSEALHATYESTYRGGRRGPWPFWILCLGGLLLIGSGLKDLGVARDDSTL